MEVIKDSGYDVIIIMDHFQCMARDTEIGSQQYETLRVYNQSRQLIYWIITDTDLKETHASKQYMSSFFAHNFTSNYTICPMVRDKRSSVLEAFITGKNADLEEQEKEMILEISGGVVQLMLMMIDLIELLKREGEMISKEILLERLLLPNGFTSLFKTWTTGLTMAQKKILYDVALLENGLISDKTNSLMAPLADTAGRGLLHYQVELRKKEYKWEISVPAFREYILFKGESFYDKEEEALPLTTWKEPTESREPKMLDFLDGRKRDGSVIVNVNGNYMPGSTLINKQTNYTVNIETAVCGLEELYQYIQNNPVLPDKTKVKGYLNQLPFGNKGWFEMEESKQEEEIEAYADKIFLSQIAMGDSLTPEQMQRFFLTEKLLSELTMDCKNQVICGIRIYDLIKTCMEKMELNMNESEAPRGILFARAFERHLKDVAAPAFCRVPELANQNVYPTSIPFKNYNVGKTTIGTYSSILERGYPIVGQTFVEILKREDRNALWWMQFVERLKKIGTLRNHCCHSTTPFNRDELTELMKLIFFENSLEDVLLMKEIPVLSPGQFTNNSQSYEEPNPSMVGHQVAFKVLKKGQRGNIKGLIEGKYEGSLPKSYAVNLDFGSIKGSTITVTIEKIQDHKYVLKL